MQKYNYCISDKYWPSHKVGGRPGVYAGLLLCFMLLLFSFLLWEWLSIGVLAISEKIADYHFGSGSMVGEGGPHYASAAVYTKSALRNAFFPILPLIILFALATVKNNTFYKALAWVSLLCTVLFNLLA